MSASGVDEAVAPPERLCPRCGEAGPPDALTCPADGATLVSVGHDPLLGRVLAGRFRLDARLGRGGMGTVYRATQLTVGRDVAVKLVDARLAADRDGARRFLREARLASRVRHPGSVGILDFGQEPDGALWLAMELVAGESLAELIAAAAPLAPRRALGLARQLAAVLAEAHALGVVHRDLKPANVMVRQDATGADHVTLLDFGIARSLTETDASTLTRSGVVCGTVAYLAPEVACGDAVDGRADLYSLGVLLYELLAGRRPFDHPRPEVLMRLHVTEPAPPLAGVSPVVERLVLRCLEKDPADRFASATALAEALVAAAETLGVDPPPAVRPAWAAAATAEHVSVAPATVDAATPAPATPASVPLAAPDRSPAGETLRAKVQAPRGRRIVAAVVVAAVAAVAVWAWGGRSPSPDAPSGASASSSSSAGVSSSSGASVPPATPPGAPVPPATPGGAPVPVAIPAAPLTTPPSAAMPSRGPAALPRDAEPAVGNTRRPPAPLPARARRVPPRVSPERPRFIVPGG